MTRFLGSDDVRALTSDELIMAAARTAALADGDGTAIAPPRLDVDLPSGFLRLMPGALGEVMGVKIMSQARRFGNRYLMLLYSSVTGELLALLDADEVTRLRTAATTALAGEVLHKQPPTAIGLLGTGSEAECHLSLMARVWPLRKAVVFSRSEERRAAFAGRMSERLGIDVSPAESAEEACASANTIVLATKSSSPVVDGGSFPPNAVVLAIGSTRPDLRELDRRTFRRVGALLVDDPRQVRLESGDVIDALGAGVLDDTPMVSLGEGFKDPTLLRRTAGRDLLCFKSVGTAVQDLALARAFFDAASRAGGGRGLGELARLKATGAPARKVPAA